MLFTTTLLAQTNDDGVAWVGTMATGRFAAVDAPYGSLRWWFDGQFRWRDEGETVDMVFARPGLGIDLDRRTSLWVGYGVFDTDPAGRPSFFEHRTWQQLNWNAPVEGFSLLSRTRLEQRFVEDQSETGWRLRQMVRATLPIDEAKTTYLAASDEVFLDLDDTGWGQREGLRQNRAYAGFGVFLNDAHTHALEIGYLHQWIDRTTVDAENHVLVITLFLNF